MPYVQAGDVKLYYVEHGDGDEALVFIHGYTSSHHNWDATLPRLPARYRAFAFDLRGAGESDRPGSGYTIEQYAEDIDLAVQALGLEKFALIGHSMGGVMAMQYAVHHPERLSKLVLVAPAPSSGITGIDPAVRAQIKALRQNRELAKTMLKAFQTRPIADEVMDQQIEDNIKWQDDAYDAAFASMQSIDLSDAVSGIQVPTLIVVGDRDFLREDNLRDAARIPHCALQVFYRVGHVIPYDVPDEFVAVLVDFLEHGASQQVPITQRQKALEEMVSG